MDSTSLQQQHAIESWVAFTSAVERQVLTGLPGSPGVYVILLGASENRHCGTSDVAYIGKATNQKALRGRVRQYFHPGPTQGTNIAMKQRLGLDGCSLRLGFIATDSGTAATRLESILLLQFENEHGELPPFNRQRALDLMPRISGDQ